MAANSIKRRFRELYEKVKDSYSDETRQILENFSNLSGKELNDYRLKVVKFYSEYLIPFFDKFHIDSKDIYHLTQQQNGRQLWEEIREEQINNVLRTASNNAISSTAKEFHINEDVVLFLLDLRSEENLYIA